ncbi:HlyC/CorC family transporter [Afifella sp. H1R]|uniref:HlyC/CorC family transporter n=1 Tax=Afifella sp. H1R TaxID=2908841 RepID=UPI001F44505D|nr:HlyC/CorC family transporter [Afifella sp. H1R]MCF1504259.1 HlyC/CorC family transporter [Afifella sp. H1R]
MWLAATLLAIVILLFLSAFFSGSETALTAASRARMHQMERSGDARAGIVSRLIDRRERMISSLLLGNNLVNILASALATAAFIDILGDAGVAAATFVMTVLVLVFAEVLPKTWAITTPDRFALAVSPFVSTVVRVFAPVVMAVQRFVSALLRLFGVAASHDVLLSGHEELRGAVDLLHREGSVQKGARDMLGGLLDLNELDVSDVMVHRTAMQALNADDPAEKLVTQVIESPFTRLPLWRGETENIVGILHAKDVLRALAAAGGDATALDIMAVASKPWFVPDTTSLQAQLNEFLRRKIHFALVVDEYGEVMGLITLEDILEEIVGEIADEHDVEIQGVRQQPDGSIIVEGTVPIRDLNRAFDWNLPDEEATTMAGLVIHEAQTIPEAGQEFTFHGFRFKVLRKTRNRLTQIRVTPVTPVATAQATSLPV